jgi:uncharacterized membrane protein YhaH (DUF805 family)
MESDVHVESGATKLRANRKVVESRCGICGNGFALGEEVAACPACGGYHHSACLKDAPSCSQMASSQEPVWSCPECGTRNPQGMPCSNAANHRQAPGASSFPGPDEKRCPFCAEIIRIEAVKCRYCGSPLNQAAPIFQSYSAPSPGSGIVETSMWSFRGRIGRGKFWLRGLIAGAIFIVVFVIAMAISDKEDPSPLTILILIPAYIGLIWFSLANQVKRWHDLDQSGWLCLLSLIPIVSLIAFVFLGFIKGTDGPNSYGEDPV